MKNVTLAHAAGIFDVRGCITLRKQYHSDVRMLEVRLATSIKQLSVLQYLQKNFGGSITNYSPTYRNGKAQMRRAWVLTGSKAKKFLVRIKPYMQNNRRRKQISFINQRYLIEKRPPGGGHLITNRDRQQINNMQNAWTKMQKQFQRSRT